MVSYPSNPQACLLQSVGKSQQSTKLVRFKWELVLSKQLSESLKPFKSASILSPILQWTTWCQKKEGSMVVVKQRHSVGASRVRIPGWTWAFLVLNCCQSICPGRRAVSNSLNGTYSFFFFFPVSYHHLPKKSTRGQERPILKRRIQFCWLWE